MDGMGARVEPMMDGGGSSVLCIFVKTNNRSFAML